MKKKKFGLLFVIVTIAVLISIIALGRKYFYRDPVSNDVWKLCDSIGTSKVGIDGLKNTEDYPYGYNVGVIEDEVVGQAILITPGTSIKIKNYAVRENDTLYISGIIHPWVSKDSDGAILEISICSKDNEKEYTIKIDPKRISEQIELNDFVNNEINITLSVTNSDGNNEICDWVILQDFAISNGTYLFADAELYADGYVRAATYFSDEWPLNFWNSEWDNLDGELKQIKEDGFESIIIVVPWREFQPDVNPISYNEYAFDKLKVLMEAAQKQNLGVYARISYTWDFYEDENDDIINRFCNLLAEGAEREAWDEYVEKMYETLKEYSCFREGFLTWEDFWNTLGVCDIQDEVERIEKADYIGYQTWVADNYSLEDYNSSYGTTYSSYEEICVPMRTDPAMYAMYEFYDAFLMELLADGQELFPNLSMEVRMDWDVVYKKDGTMDYYKHVDTFNCLNSSYTATMYGIPMGFENKGEKVSAKQAIEKTEYILDQLKLNNNNKPVFIEQFIFADNTPKFSNNAQIIENELNDYLLNVSDVLLEKSEGYGIWTYRNYCANMVYNSQFALGNQGWDSNDEVEIRFDLKLDTNVCDMEKGGYISQNIPLGRNHFVNEQYTVSFDVKSITKEGVVSVTMGNESTEAQISEAGTIAVVLEANDSFDLKIESKDCDIVIDNIKLYSQIQQGYLYDENNEELQCIPAVRKMNDSLK